MSSDLNIVSVLRGAFELYSYVEENYPAVVEVLLLALKAWLLLYVSRIVFKSVYKFLLALLRVLLVGMVVLVAGWIYTRGAEQFLDDVGFLSQYDLQKSMGIVWRYIEVTFRVANRVGWSYVPRILEGFQIKEDL